MFEQSPRENLKQITKCATQTRTNIILTIAKQNQTTALMMGYDGPWVKYLDPSSFSARELSLRRKFSGKSMPCQL
jgi:hypothetical protein